MGTSDIVARYRLSRPIYSKRNTAEIFDCSESTVDRMIRAGKLKSMKVGGRVKIFADSIAEKLDEAARGEPTAA